MQKEKKIFEVSLVFYINKYVRKKIIDFIFLKKNKYK